MAKAPSSRSTAKSKKRDPNLLAEFGFPNRSPSVRLRNWIFRPSFLAWLTLAATIIVSWPWIFSQTEHLKSLPEYRLDADQIVILNRPEWVPVHIIDEVLADLQLPEETTILDEHLADDVALAFHRHPWVEEVVAVRKSYPNTIEAELIFRRPIALVRVAQGVYPIDVNGTLLPPGDFSPATIGNYLQIEGIVSIPGGRPGSNWGDLAVVGAARVAAVLHEKWKEWQITAIRASRPTKAQMSLEEFVYELRGADGSIIVWGRAPGSKNPGELTTEQKLGRLEKYVHDYGQFDPAAAQPTWRIDLRDWKAISRTQMTELPRKSPVR
ncbi:MAG: hypothetical protein O2955_20650 [Planctomycetota bacterium]|nr:hypothetical protein [Planctomycetota bacterium]MDA1214920.1 hypothetical protein [Planctomycetota bacterium]